MLNVTVKVGRVVATKRDAVRVAGELCVLADKLGARVFVDVLDREMWAEPGDDPGAVWEAWRDSWHMQGLPE